jgi:aspartyl-tRNA(Asn)/glutamyl-tRNA(Gln) amidotransferase subunit B
MGEYKPTIGLEIHAELKTQTKMFCASINDPEEKTPNVNICPVCMAHPGTLPVVNKKAVKYVLKVGKALGSRLADFTEFDRKNYFYPDIPKGYQISQYKYPLVSGGELAGVDITRVHLEEDTARSTHHDGYSLVDFNRAGLPLMELVTEPVVTDSKQAGLFARELQLLLRTLGVSDANMEKGEMRVEANISISKTDTFGTKVEVKNLNSFKIVEKAIEFEIKRQASVLESGGEVVQETRGWDENKSETFSQRAKESAHDYRYFPDPDLPKLKISEIAQLSDENLASEMPELPWEKRERYKKEYGIKDEGIESFVVDKKLGEFFEKVIADFAGDKSFIKLASNYITSDLLGLMKGKEDIKFPDAKDFAKLIEMANAGDISSRATKDILVIMYEKGGDPEGIANAKNLIQKSDEGELKEIVETIIKESSEVVAEYKAGKESALQFLIGQGMRATKGSANPQILKKLFIKYLTD